MGHGKKKLENQAPNRKSVIVQLQPSLAEKLATKRAVADELEGKLQTLRSEFDEKLSLADSMKQELNRREEQLMQSVKNIEGYIQEIYSLKRVAEDMYERFEEQVNESETREQGLLEECIDISRKRNTAIELLKSFQPAKLHLEDLSYGQPNASSAKEMVEYFLVLRALKEDLLEEDVKRLEKEKRVNCLRQQVVEGGRVHPLSIRAQEDSLQRIKAQTKDIHDQNVELEQQVDNAMSSKLKQDLLWYDTERWANKLCKSVEEALPVHAEDTGKSNLDQLQKIYEFVVIGTKISSRLKEDNGV